MLQLDQRRIQKTHIGVPVMSQWLTNWTRNHEVAGLIPGFAQWVKDLALLWLWCRLAATAPIRPLAWEPPYATRAAQENSKKTKKKKKICIRLKKNHFLFMVSKWEGFSTPSHNCADISTVSFQP